LIDLDGTTSSYDANGNLTARGSDTFAWNWANQLTSATVTGTTADYAYDGNGNRVSATTGGTATSYLWDDSSGLPTLVDDGTNAYLSADGLQAAIDGSGTTSYALDDALGSVRGLTDASGSLIESTDYDVFGAVRSQTGARLPLGFTGELTDPTTGFLDLRARDLDPSLGRFLSRDTVTPNAPGSQGYNPYAYVANNPTTWTDPSGQSIGSAASEMLYLLQAAFRIRQYATTIIEGITLLDVGSPLQKVGGALDLAFTAVACALDAPCRALAEFSAKVIDTYGSMAPAGPWTVPIQSMRFAIHHFPTIPTSVLCTINTVGGIYEATRGIPTSVGVDNSGGSGVNTGSGAECDENTGSTGSDQRTARIFEPSPKHDPLSGWDSLMDLNPETAAMVLNKGIVGPNGRQVYGFYDGVLYEFQQHEPGRFHGYPVPGGKENVPNAVLKEMRKRGIINQPQFNKLRKGQGAMPMGQPKRSR
jgi:RHS repeat-associated protein